jgi:8-oxo-dGTP pyrophosphatase MutT (NUDIX family)
MKRKRDKFSVGIIAYTKINNEFKYLLICRRCSLTYMAFLMGNYKINNIEYIKTLFNLMTKTEKSDLLKYDFEKLWYNLWISNKNYNLEKNKFLNFKKKYNIKSIIENTTDWGTPEWGFPKGRLENHETYKDCGLREFNEETGYKNEYIKIIDNVLPFNEYVIGSNKKLYKHKYYLANFNLKYINDYKIQEFEVSELKWFTLSECIKKIRSYNIEKINIIKNVDKFLNNYKIILY